jgi:hypothetical protein
LVERTVSTHWVNSEFVSRPWDCWSYYFKFDNCTEQISLMRDKAIQIKDWGDDVRAWWGLNIIKCNTNIYIDGPEEDFCVQIVARSTVHSL